MGMMLGSSVPSIEVGQIITPLVLIVYMIFGGLFVNLDKVPEVFRWIQWISFISYTNKVYINLKE
jgi:ABC-type multidrug transport system permease subunit